MNKHIVYMDNAATTQPFPEVAEAVNRYMTINYGNPGGHYTLGRTAKDAVFLTRHLIASTLNAKPKEIYFTSGGTESDNWAIRGVAEGYPFPCGIVTTAIEHKAVIKTCEYLKKFGNPVTYIEPDERGIITPRQVKQAITPETRIVSVMMVNNEIGTIEPIKEIGKICHDNGVIFHVDAVQAYGHMRIDVNDMDIDLLSASSHKFHGPKGCGFLYVRDGIPFSPLIFGGGQEDGMRAGTENVPGIVGMGVAAKICYENMEDKIALLTSTRDQLIDGILRQVPNSELNGSLVSRASNNVSIRFDGIRGEELQLLLEMNGIYTSTGSACNSDDSAPSHVLTAIGLTPDQANSTIRLTLSEMTKPGDVDLVVEVLKNSVEQLRSVR